MDGRALIETFLDLVSPNEDIEVFRRDDNYRLVYHFLDLAAGEFVRETRCLTTTVDITTVLARQAYDLPPDFLALWMKNANDRNFCKYDDGTTLSYPVLVPYERIFRSDPDVAERPTAFAVTARSAVPTVAAGTATSAGARSAGRCTLTDSAALFTTDELVYPRDLVHNTTDGADGIVLSVSSATQITTALFKGRTNAWTSGNAYVIQRATGARIVLDHPSAVAGHTITVPYYCMPAPVYSDYDVWGLPPASCRAICAEAVFLFRNRSADLQKRGAKAHHPLFVEEVNRVKGEAAARSLQGGRARMLA